MTENVFLDTNVVLYLLSADTTKADQAEVLVRSGAIISVQVLNEVTAVCRRKLHLPWDDLDTFLVLLKRACRIVPLTLATHEAGIQLARRYQITVFDALICASAIDAGAKVLMTEDLNHGQVVAGLRLHNPFR